MSRLGRVCAVISVCFGAIVASGGSAFADHCDPIDVPAVGQDRTYCHTPQPTPKPPTPAPTTAPTTAPATQAPQPANPRPAAPAGPTRTSAPSTPAGTPFDIEVPEEEPLATTEVDVILEDTSGLGDEVDQAGSVGNTIIGFIVGFLVGALIGRASWGFRRRRGRQQIFG